MKTQTELSHLQKFYKKLDELEMPYESRVAIIKAASKLDIDRWEEGFNSAKEIYHEDN